MDIMRIDLSKYLKKLKEHLIRSKYILTGSLYE